MVSKHFSPPKLCRFEIILKNIVEQDVAQIK